ncbi:MAG: EamA/RhaT family transporter [Thiopseudomonas sp.]|nr:EamA/RhaT family transporter [Thiopseudomonas sp.]
MILLACAIAASVAVSILLKLARRFQLQIAQSVLVNYGVASGLTLYLLKPAPAALLQLGPHWPLLATLGLLLPSVFLIMAAAVDRAGIARSDAAQRLSLVLPLLAAFIWFGESADTSKLLGLGLALLALTGLIHRDASPEERKGGWLLLPAVWLGYGIIDIGFKQMAKTGSGFAAILLACFVLSGLLLAGWLLLRKTRWHLPSLAAGVLLGALNFANIYAYIRAHQSLPDNPALVFTAMNIGVIALGSLTGLLLFRERLSLINLAGLLLAGAAILLLMPPL